MIQLNKNGVYIGWQYKWNIMQSNIKIKNMMQKRQNDTIWLVQQHNYDTCQNVIGW